MEVQLFSNNLTLGSDGLDTSCFPFSLFLHVLEEKTDGAVLGEPPGPSARRVYAGGTGP